MKMTWPMPRIKRSDRSGARLSGMETSETGKFASEARKGHTYAHRVIAFCCTFMLGANSPAASQSLLEAKQLLKDVRLWGCQYQNIELDKLDKLPLDLLVIEPALSQDPERDFSRDQIERLKKNPEGRRRLVFAYLSVGEAGIPFLLETGSGQRRPDLAWAVKSNLAPRPPRALLARWLAGYPNQK